MITTSQDWLKKHAPLFQPIRSKPKPIATHVRTFSRALSQLHEFTTSFDCFSGLSGPFVIGSSDFLSLVLQHTFENPPI